MDGDGENIDGENDMARKGTSNQRAWDLVKTIGEVVVLIAKFFLRQ